MMMSDYEIIPHIGVGPVRLGMDRSAARDAMALPFQTFKKSSASKSATDAYLGNCFQVFFDDANTVQFIELSSPLRAIYKSVFVFEVRAEDVVKVVACDAEVDQSASEPGYSFIYPSLEMSLWRPTVPDEDQPENDYEGRYFSSVGIGKNGYYSRQNK
jgi:hypothetical protein